MKPQDLFARLEAGYEYDPMYGELCNERDRLADENEKLRELVRDMFRDFANADYELKCHHGKTFMAVTRYEPRLQELGIEVDE